jgi:hypothetical protein
LEFGESWFGGGVGVPNLVVYTIGIGVGAGVIIDGMPFRGEEDVVSEIGQVPIDWGPTPLRERIGCLGVGRCSSMRDKLSVGKSFRGKISAATRDALKSPYHPPPSCLGSASAAREPTRKSARSAFLRAPGRQTSSPEQQSVRLCPPPPSP